MSDTEQLEYPKKVSEHDSQKGISIPNQQDRADTTESPEPGLKRPQLERVLPQELQKIQRFLNMEGTSWYIDPVPDVNLRVKTTYLGKFPPEADSITPVMLLGDPGKIMHHNSDWLANTFKSVEKDRAYHRIFASCILLKRQDENWTPSEGDLNILRERGCQTLVDVETTTRVAGRRQDGIYCVIGESLHRVFRLFADPQGAFMCGIVHEQKDLTLHDVSDLGHEDVGWISKFPPGEKQFHKLNDPRIPIPYSYNFSLLWSDRKPPLDGVTIAVKDVFDIEGFPTTASSRAYASHRGDAKSTASVVDTLISFGATIVGKTKTTQFASGENAADWVDFQCPFNPRGDGSFEPYCSSTGAAAAVAAYDWIDAAIGTDTLGSIIQPAAGHGVFGLRPSHNGESSGDLGSTGCLGNSAFLDTLGPLTRSLKTLRVLTECMYGSKEPCGEKFPSRLLYPPGLFAAQPQGKRVLLDAFVDDILANFSIERQRSLFDIAEEWRTSGHSAADTPIQDYLHNTLAHIQLYGSYHNNLEFCREYEAKHGHSPLVNPLVQYKWKLGSELTKQQHDEACKRQMLFRTFLDSCVFTDNTILALPASLPDLIYRNDSTQIPFETRAQMLQGFGFDLHQCSYVAGLPELVIPIGQVPVVSKTTGKSTYEPVCIALIGPRGSDHHLIDIAEKVFKKRGHSDYSVQTGETAFKVDTA